jgi:hypothetical protein
MGLHGFESRRHLGGNTRQKDWAIGAAVARFPDTEEVTGSIPVSPTGEDSRSALAGDIPMRRTRVVGQGLVGLIALVVLALSGCSLPTPVIPEDVYEAVRTDDRERNYDLAWQEIRVLNAQLDVGFDAELTDEILWVLARMHRLERGAAGQLGDVFTAQTIAVFTEEGRSRSAEDNLAVMKRLGLELQDSFDEGDFAAAKNNALELYGLGLALTELSTD